MLRRQEGNKGPGAGRVLDGSTALRRCQQGQCGALESKALVSHNNRHALASMLRWVTDWGRRWQAQQTKQARRQEAGPLLEYASTACGSERNVFMATTRLERHNAQETPVSSQSKSSVK